MRYSKRYKKNIPLYLHFARDYEYLDFSETACVEMYNYESFGGSISPNNGFLCGKRMLNLTVAMWKEDIQKGILFRKELYDDNNLPNWWLDKVL